MVRIFYYFKDRVMVRVRIKVEIRVKLMVRTRIRRMCFELLI